MLGRAEAESASRDPQQFVPDVNPSRRSASSRPGEHGELMAQEQVLEDQILAFARRGLHGREQEAENIKHGVSIAELHAREVLPSHSSSRSCCLSSTTTSSTHTSSSSAITTSCSLMRTVIRGSSPAKRLANPTLRVTPTGSPAPPLCHALPVGLTR